MPDNEMPTIEEMQAAFGIGPTDEGDPDPGPDPNPADDGNEPEPSPEDPPASGEEEKEGEPQPDGGDDGTDQKDLGQNPQNQEQAKLNQAFARMRTQNAQLVRTVQMMAQVLGVNPNQDMDALSDQLQTQARNAIAKSQNIDPQLLARMEHLEAVDAEYTRMRLQTSMEKSLQTISQKYGATDEDLNVFVTTLAQEGFNPMDVNGDLESEFIKRNFATIQQRAIENAVRAEQERSVKGSGASTPSGKQGQADKTDPQEINTVADLDKFLSDASN